jgi:hypothetical protein
MNGTRQAVLGAAIVLISATAAFAQGWQPSGAPVGSLYDGHQDTFPCSSDPQFLANGARPCGGVITVVPARPNQMAVPSPPPAPAPAPSASDIADYCGVCLVGIPKFNKVMGVEFEDHTEFARSRGNPIIGASYSVPVEEYERLGISPPWRRLLYCDTPEFYAFRHANQLGFPGHLSKCARAWPAPNMSLIAVPNHDWHRPADTSWSNRLP